MPWPEDIVSKTLKEFQIRVKISEDIFISISLLEYATILINYAATSQAFVDRLIISPHPFSVVQIDADNTNTISWTKKAASVTAKSKALSRVFASLTLNNSLGIATTFLSGKNNILPDLISRLNSSPTALTLPQILEKFPWMSSCRRFRPSHALVSNILSALLNNQDLELT